MQTFVNPLQVITAPVHTGQNIQQITPPLTLTAPLPRKRSRDAQPSTSSNKLPLRKKQRVSAADVDIIDMEIIDISSDQEDSDIQEVNQTEYDQGIAWSAKKRQIRKGKGKAML